MAQNSSRSGELKQAIICDGQVAGNIVCYEQGGQRLNAKSNIMSEQLVMHGAPAERWPGLETLFGQHGAYAGCWCVFWSLKRADFSRAKGEGTKKALHEMSLHLTKKYPAG